jgi:DNA-binding Xre family transcriptional regulator
MLLCSYRQKEAEIRMIVYNKLADYLKANNMTWTVLQKAIGISPSVMARLQKNRGCNTETIDKVCAYLHVQPGDIMEWVENENDLKKREIQSQIDALQKQLSEME